MFECSCGKEFPSKMSLAGHKTSCGKSFEKKCDICGRITDVRKWKEHVASHKRDSKCPTCGGVIFGIDNKKFCDHSCAARYNNLGVRRHGKRTRKKCAYCGKILRRAVNKYCGYDCLKKHAYERYIEAWLCGRKTGNWGDQIQPQVRLWLFERAENACEGILDDGSRCGWSRMNQSTGKIPLCAHHKDGDHKNTTPENLELLCPCCHSLTDNYGSRNKGSGRDSRKKWRKKKKAGIA